MIGSKIKRLRIAKGLTQQQLIDGLFDRSYLSNIERGKIIPPVETLALLATRLEVPLSQLTDYMEVISKVSEMLDNVRKTKDIQLVRKAFTLCVRVEAIESMIECVLEWSRIQLPNLNQHVELLEAINHTIFLMGTLDEEFPQNVDLLLCRANTYFYLGMLDQAILAYKGLEQRDLPNELLGRIKISLGSTLIRTLNYKAAYEKLQEALELADLPEALRARAHQGLGVCCRYLGQWSAAEHYSMLAGKYFLHKDFNRYIHIQHGLGILWLDKLDFDKAAKYFAEAQEYYRANHMMLPEAQLCEEFVRAEFYKGRFEEANAFCNRGLQLLKGLDAALAGKFFLWKSRIYLILQEPSREEDAWQAAKGLLGPQLKTTIDTMDPNMPKEIKQNFYKKIGE
ncbi:hypothetical protein AAC03nite_34210 [Alicyclobacillus acidoterrestris]|uniref:helix-turn-helix domain-containing protein n=1 Tax=Alicyclobacillus suci TaxID=2816080 RepID=UPI0011939370|nr:helix-turn-helix transcriptional regulator [Alicyclobacillus suci]GEO27636.1 hypothetical protein AAC03nite_34210 [Alicyclobacillus acidoterrestris]